MSTSTEHELRELANRQPSPFKASYGKLLMWFFLISDTFTFAAFLMGYASSRFANSDTWPVPETVFDTIPVPALDKLFSAIGFDTHHMPLVFVTIMTSLLIASSVTMVRAVQEGIQMNKSGVIKWLIPTIIFGAMFLGCQYYEWTHLMHEGMTITANPFSKLGMFGVDGVTTMGPTAFAMFFFAITGFHGLHVLVGVLLNIWLLVSTANGRFEKVGHYEMVEKIGLYWHFVDLVWVYVFLSYYLL